MAEGSPKLGRSLPLSLSLGWLASVNVFATLLIHWHVITRLGIGAETDALFAGMVVPQIVLVLFTSSLLPVLVPLLAAGEAGGGGLALRRELWGIVLLVACVAAVTAAALCLSAGYWMRWLVPGFSAERYALAVALTRVQLCGLLFAAVDCVLRAACRARRSFVWAEAATPLSNIIGLLILFWALPRYGVLAAAWVMVLRIALPVAFMWPVMGGWVRPRLWSPVRAEALRRVRPLLFGGLYNHVPPLITRQLASLAPAGGLSLLSVTQQLYGTVNAVTDKALVVPASPALAVHARNGEWREFSALYYRRLALMGLLAAAGYATVLGLGRHLLTFAVGHGSVTAANVDSLWLMMCALGVAFVSNALGQPVFAAFCATGDTRTPVRLAFIINTVNIPFRVCVFWAYGLFGMALAMSAGAAAGLLVNIFVLEKSLTRAGERESERASEGGPCQEGQPRLASAHAVDAT